MSFLLSIALLTLALTGVVPAFSSPTIVWTRPLNMGPGGALSISAGTKGVYVGGGDELRRYDSDGNMVWTMQVSPPAMVTGVAVGTGGVYVVGTRGSAFVDLYGFDGALIWTRYFGVGYVETASVSVGTGSVYVAETMLIHQPWPMYDTAHTLVAKFDTRGSELWVQLIDVDSKLATAISVGPRGVYVAEKSHAPIQCHDCPSFTDTFFTAIDTNGSTLWTRQLNNETLDVECSCSSTLSAGTMGVYVGENTVVRTPLGQYVQGSFIRMYDFRGNALWTRPSNETFGISADSKGVYVAGDGIVQHLDSEGNVVWTLNIGGQFLRTVSVSNPTVFVAGFSTLDKLCSSPSCA